jgi:hypothetical protein
MYGLRNHEHPNEIKGAYIRFFAGEVSDFLAVNLTVPSRSAGADRIGSVTASGWRAIAGD